MVQTRGSKRLSAGPPEQPPEDDITGPGGSGGAAATARPRKAARRAAAPTRPARSAPSAGGGPRPEPPPTGGKDAEAAGAPVPTAAAGPDPARGPAPVGRCWAPFDTPRELFVGAHVSGAGGLWKAAQEAHGIGARSFALFLGSQRTWTRKPLSDADCDQFRQAMQSYGYSPAMVVPHGSYLMNLGSPDPETRRKSRDMLLDELRRCERLQLPLFNFHPGSTCGKISREQCISHIADGVNAALRATRGVTVLLENMSRQGNTIGGDFSELRAIMDQVEEGSRVAVCLDTCHAHAAGYDLATKVGFQSMMDDFERTIGLDKLRAVHLNDSKSAVGSHLDRHENIGKGTIGRAGIARVLADPRFQRMPIVLETPYVDDDIYRREIKLLYGMIDT